MIDKNEIEEKAKQFQINTSNLQRDYVFGWLLSGIYSQSPLSNKFILKGGNGLRKGYLPNTRFSKDLDFSIIDDISDEFIAQNINEVCKFAQDRTGIVFEVDKTRVLEKQAFDSEQKRVLETRIFFKSFYGEEEISIKVQLDVTTFDQILLPVQTRNLIHLYSDAESCSTAIKCQKLEEILASKLNTLLQRRKATDLFDLIYSIVVNNDPNISKVEVVSTFLRKYIYQNDPLSAQNQLLNVPVEEFRPFWSELIAPIFSLFDFDNAITNFRVMVNSLFDLVAMPSVNPVRVWTQSSARFGGYSTYGASQYFSSDNRNKIITAGRANRLIELVYDGIHRMIEPYAFEYRVRKKDGAGVEYFWGWDQTGGNSGKVGIKMFIQDKIQSVELTDMGFAPRYVVEF